MRKAPLFTLVCLLIAVAGGSYAAKRLLEGSAAPTGKVYCPSSSLFRGVTGPEPAPTMPLREKRVALLVNEFRRQHHLGLLRSDATLALAARAHSDDMLRGRYFAHDTTRESFVQRLARYTPSSCIAENLAWGEGAFGTAQGIVEAWKRSPEHRKVMLLPWARSVGVGVRAGRFLGAPGAVVATADFAG